MFAILSYLQFLVKSVTFIYGITQPSVSYTYDTSKCLTTFLYKPGSCKRSRYYIVNFFMVYCNKYQHYDNGRVVNLKNHKKRNRSNFTQFDEAQYTQPILIFMLFVAGRTWSFLPGRNFLFQQQTFASLWDCVFSIKMASFFRIYSCRILLMFDQN